ncbi:enoyl-CoA hydratase [Rhodococcus sp. 15-725-2-2b]|uniref:enoyl-CoA hydratase-related protein n=1 Tax=unclassified Rhodococcus (in: high G+C Gram-positive bacteria) TaxID=192944 RepID=UPI000B9B3C20|nr:MULTISPECIES: enoyl-CoA hydratase-related protein [unclassified Rhodococcus (in: high G+C Gram-positive bacteria)]OZC63652.1 enoyl-CoA hydratase [Rhodococcus sp. 06-469-3-2]OZD40817.1 enoyl-CoA hydratase [Rhodococcus sp. 06-1477-1A]OZE67075.1 enoyl-CoA hydratase [Rhodococcus sp. 15-725-2-2b]
MREYEQIKYSVDGPVVTVSLNRPAARNGYTVMMSKELADAFAVADSDDSVRVVVFTGEGKDFCVGADLSGGSFDTTGDADLDETFLEPAGQCSMQIFRMNKPVIAAIRGVAVGAGSSILLSADFRLAAEDARFGFVFTRRGIVPEGASTWFLPRLVGLPTAVDWMISGRVFGAEEARAAGLVTEIQPEGRLLARAYEIAHELVANTAPVSVAITRQLLYRMSSQDLPFSTQLLHSKLIANVLTTADAAEGVTSFLERRRANFPGKVSADLPSFLPWVESPADEMA